jgi:hypothetical protein
MGHLTILKPFLFERNYEFKLEHELELLISRFLSLPLAQVKPETDDDMQAHL